MKDKIRFKGIEMFNSFGVSNVSMKQIADSLNISAGNLQYHYRNKEALLTIIYDTMISETLHYILPKSTNITLYHYQEMMLSFDALQSRYSFFFNDLVHIIKKYPDVGKRQEAINLVRFKDARKLVDYYVQTDRMVPETGLINYDKMVHVIWMSSTFWQSQRQVIKTNDYQINKCSVMDMLWSIIMPYLTRKGIEEYEQIKNT
ncbi:TetR/AcrR family transcriptional regulator [Cellulophaga sp. HaHaR_3_176]|uniref:TetR/AcrR family transcriptional regulator n=1 Tax=Cellulophaga sp. HaHaR_3_176 TaxID=1942464 RepID=UPI001C1F7AFC|nr:TetR/AcrR family transcriptional regulator [Cellulophaga sp. HaHaR_3_176]QWX85228.1 TetR/AcrR family transcriptional regulator [Cellulophaga sp. HaHaR_3_176]